MLKSNQVTSKQIPVINVDLNSIGCSINMQDRMVDIVRTEFPEKQYCIVEHWCWNHVELSDIELCKCRNAGVHPEFVYADVILHDTNCRHCTTVKSTFMSELINNCIFVTASTCYILINKGKFCTTKLRDAVDPAFQNSLNEC